MPAPHDDPLPPAPDWCGLTAERDVSVVIPTLHRPELLTRAVRSVFAQTHPAHEIIVVVDGPDPATREVLARLSHPRLRVVQNERSLGSSGARNVGVAVSTGTWIAFLDDDDEWLERKLELQLDFALERNANFVTCLSWVVTPEGTYCWPTTIHDPNQPFDTYLFERRSFFAGDAFLQTSSHLIRRTTYDLAPFRPGIAHDDWDFSLRQTKGAGTRLDTVPEPLVNHYIDYKRVTAQSFPTWQISRAWVKEMRPLLTRPALSGFYLGVIGPRAASEHAWTAAPILLWDSFCEGAPGLYQLLTYLAFWTTPPRLRRLLRSWFTASFRPASRLAPPYPADF